MPMKPDGIPEPQGISPDSASRVLSRLTKLPHSVSRVSVPFSVFAKTRSIPCSMPTGFTDTCRDGSDGVLVSPRMDNTNARGAAVSARGRASWLAPRQVAPACRHPQACRLSPPASFLLPKAAPPGCALADGLLTGGMIRPNQAVVGRAAGVSCLGFKYASSARTSSRCAGSICGVNACRASWSSAAIREQPWLNSRRPLCSSSC